MPTDTLHLQPSWLHGSAPRKGRYVLGPRLGEGGMGEVREAWDLVLKRTVALKILRAMDPVSLIRFMHEAQLQARVSHPNICRIYDVESTEGAPRIAMQLVDGGRTLADLAHQLTVAEIIGIFIQVAEAVQAAHRLRLVHRDLKPSNILLEPAPDGGWTPYVCDFGLAMALEEPALTTSNGFRGTPAYMAPEQLRGDRQLIGPATDVFALGGTLFFALYGRIPEGGCLDLPGLLGQRLKPPALPPCPKAPLPRDLEALLLKCLEPDPGRRYASMAVLAQALRGLGRGEPAPAVRPSWRTLGPVRPGRGRGVLAAVSLASVGLVLGLLMLDRQLDHRRDRRLAAARSFALAASELEHELQMEKMLPGHDLRPGYARIRQRMGLIQAQMAALGADGEGPGRLALGRARFLMGDLPGAREDLERAWACGDHDPEVAEALAQVLVLAAPPPEAQDLSGQGPPTSGGDATCRRVEALFGQGQGQPPGWAGLANDEARALLAFSQRDFARAAAAARACLVDAPWRFDAATLEALSLQALGRQQALAGDPDGAERSFSQAMEAARRSLALAPSDPGLFHAYLLAGRAQAGLARHRGALPRARLTELVRLSQEALRLDPDRPDLQDDWLRIRLLQAACRMDLGQDPQPELTSALAFLDARARSPLTPALKADRTLLQWGLASWPRAKPHGPPFAGRLEPFGSATMGY